MPRGAAAGAPKALAAIPAATAKSRMAVGSRMAVRRAAGTPVASSHPSPAPQARYSTRAATMRASLTRRCSSLATSQSSTRRLTVPKIRTGWRSRPLNRSRVRVVQPASRGSATTRARVASSPSGEVVECAPSRPRIGPASRTVPTVDATSSPAARAASPPARPVKATEATSAGATPAASTPPRNAWPLTSWLASHAHAGKATVVTASTSTMRREAARSAAMSLNVIDAPVQNTRTARVIRMAFAPSRRRPGPGNAMPRAAENSTRSRRNRSSAAAAPASQGCIVGGPPALCITVMVVRPAATDDDRARRDDRNFPPAPATHLPHLTVRRAHAVHGLFDIPSGLLRVQLFGIPRK